MAGTSQQHREGPGSPAVVDEGLGGWATAIMFGAALTILVGVFQIFEGVVALADEGYYRVRPDGLPLDVSWSVWGWLHVVIGAAAVVVGIGILAGSALARFAAVVVAWLSAVTHLVFLPAAPVWGLFVIAVAVVVIYSLVVHGRDLDLRPTPRS